MIQKSLGRTANFVYENSEQFQKMNTIVHYYSLNCLIGQNDEMAVYWFMTSDSTILSEIDSISFLLRADLPT